MPIFDIIVLSAIIAVFMTFGVVLAAVGWYCSDGRKRPIGAHHRHYGFPDQTGLITDDD
jgi:hypothetical protein